MITRLYVNNFRCLVAFEARFEPFVVLCGHNGAGKNAVFDALRLIRDLTAGDAILGGDRESDIPHLEFTKWLQSDVQEFELSLTSAGHEFQYLVHLQQVVAKEKPRIVKERATCDGRTLFERNLESVRFYRLDGTEAGSFPLDWRQTALAAIQPHGHLADVEALQKAMANLVILRPNPRGMERESKAELRRPDLYLAGLTSWYRWLAQDFERAKILHDQLREVWPDCRSLGLVDVGLNTKALQLRFDGMNGGDADGLYFEQLSDGEKALIALYMIRTALATGTVETVWIDEPDNYVGLPELQPWVLSMREVLDGNRQVVLITHHPEVLSSAGRENGLYLWRDNHTSPTRIGAFNVPQGISAAEAIARGWV
jgi:predicted ATPase